jgi:hypothetical protein
LEFHPKIIDFDLELLNGEGLLFVSMRGKILRARRKNVVVSRENACKEQESVRFTRRAERL